MNLNMNEEMILRLESRVCTGRILAARRPSLSNFLWKILGKGQEPDVELWLNDSSSYPPDSMYRSETFARYFDRNTLLHEKGVLEIRRGGGIAFEFGVVLGVLAVLELEKRRKQ
jgi:hypothetical protein